MSYLYGLDLSMNCSGVAIFDFETLKPVHIGSIKTNDKYTHGKRLFQIGKEMLELTDKYPPKVIIIERGFSRFSTSTQVIYRVHGLINYLFHDIEQIYYPPKKVKETIIRGDATKQLVRKKIEEKYPYIKFENEDESDAFAVALTYLIKNKLLHWDKNMNKKKSKSI